LETGAERASAGAGSGRRAKTVTRGGAWAISLVTALVVGGAVGGGTYYLTTRDTPAAAPSSPSTGATPSAGASGPAQAPTSGTNTAQVPPAASSAAAPDWAVVAQAVQPTVVAIRVSAGTFAEAQGSGVIINSVAGYVVTNNHVVADSTDIQIVMSDGRVFEASVLGTDPSTDLAVIELDNPPTDLKEAAFGDSSVVVVGEPVMAVGNPLGLDNTATTGIVSALNRPVTTQASGYQSGDVQVVTNAIQVDAAVNPGNSGGPLFNAEGKVIGINSSIATMTDVTTGNIGLAFAIPANLVANVARQLVDSGVAVHPYLGVRAASTIVDAGGVRRAGALIDRVERGTPAEQVGLEADDVIIAVDGNPITGSDSLTAWIRSYNPGDKVALAVVRAGAQIDLEATLTTRED
jgi:putative serine protease PepD